MLNPEVAKFIEKLQPDLIQYRRETHRHPELGLTEVETTKRAKALLEKYGVKPTILADNIGLYFLLEGGLPGETLLLRGDLDALPIQEIDGVDFKSEVPGVMHACGHDCNSAMVIGAAIVANTFKELVHGKILFLLQPAEEIAAGAKLAIERGILDVAKPKYGLCFHVSPNEPVGTVSFYQDKALAASDHMKLTVKGKGGHGAFPHMTIDPIVLSAQVIMALQTFAARYHKPVDPLVVTIGSIHGGKAANVTPAEVEMLGTVRSFSKTLHDSLGEKITKLCKMTTQAMGGDCDVDYEVYCDAIVSTPELTAFIKNALVKGIGEEHINIFDEPMMGSEDFGFFTKYFPCNQVRIGTSYEEPRSHISSHNAEVMYHEDGILWGTRAICSIMMEQ